MSTQDKNSFHYRMSKKVAELTQVVHMLFTRNHEKEIEMVAMKESYEYEIELVIKDAKSRIAKLENKLAELSQEKLYIAHAEQNISQRDLVIEENETKWRQILLDKETCLQNENIKSQNLQETLNSSNREVETLKQRLAQEIAAKSEELAHRDEEVKQIITKLTVAENRLNNIHRTEQSMIDELQRNNEKLASEIIQLQSLLNKSNQNSALLINRNKQLESDVKELKAQYRRLSKALNKPNKDTKSPDVNEELERLKMEVQRYRLELSNRDNNFTKMFCEKQPGLVTQRSPETQQKGLMSVVVPPGYTRNTSPFGAPRVNSSTFSLSKERPSLLGRKLSTTNSIACERLDDEINAFNYEQILNDYEHHSTQMSQTLIEVRDSVNNEQETTNNQTSRNNHKLPSLHTARESNQLTRHLAKPKIFTKSSLFVK
ncbi:protein FAM184A-like [Biomphalaria glabrata]|uniref:Protein FAM184A-like n=1 Tax=Biomphalaria glabrata TaxID=6526 RepID=A0A9W3AE53_BIOGL|nr:protein FAM184A-like [Biomphalaria glabrata]XP_055885587.1 protein FAM184A-like [Biomphalaria glabrata]XP_055885595.1 protein FAM184A-like [Biomphalaria glabrata]XP_055885602.1 protein FAM184A-like [Biomphalaria glabrata]XP_055885608.1 protein FAM184A-like [Biomphalaria glabrata]